jgi:hypothetical protein
VGNKSLTEGNGTSEDSGYRIKMAEEGGRRKKQEQGKKA